MLKFNICEQCYCGIGIRQWYWNPVVLIFHPKALIEIVLNAILELVNCLFLLKDV